MSCRNWLHEFCSLYRDICFDYGRKLLREKKTAKCRRGCRIFRSLQLSFLSSLGWNIVYWWYIFYFNVDIASVLRISSKVLIYLSCLLNSQDILKKRHLSLPKSGVCTGMSGRDAAGTTLFRCPVSQRLSLLQIYCTQLSKVETLDIICVNFQPFWRFADWVIANVAKSVASLGITPTYIHTHVRTRGHNFTAYFSTYLCQQRDIGDSVVFKENVSVLEFEIINVQTDIIGNSSELYRL
jgi:hypothetical protein